jgi:glycosyltransferase involved in cell wall biosynthesis
MNLTIAIPTYNRPEQLTRTLRKLIPQLTTRCRLLIVDNSSEPPVIDTLSPLLAEYDNPLVRVVRNKTNIGGNANILRCMELCDTAWLWTMGDDDRVLDDAVEKVLEGIDSNASCACVNFTQLIDNRTEALTTCGRTAFLSVLGRHFWSLMFISCSVYRVNAILPSLMYGYIQIPSYAPHLAVLLMALDQSETVHFSEKIIVEYIPAQSGAGWSAYWVELGLPLLLDLPLGSGDRVLLRKVLRSRLRFKTLLALYVNVLCYGWRTGDLAVCSQLFRTATLRRLTVTGSLFESVLIFVFQMSLLAPSLALLVTQMLFRTVRGQPLREWALSVGLGPERV